MQMDRLSGEAWAESDETEVSAVQGRLHHLELDMQEERDVQLGYILNNLSIHIACFDIEFYCHFVNQSFCNAFGHVPERWIGARLAEILPANWLEHLEPAMMRALCGRKTSLNFAVTAEDGQVLYKHAMIVPQHGMLGVDKTRMGLLMLVSDYSEQAMAQQKLMALLSDHEELKVALDAHAIVAVTDARGVITRVNDKFCSIAKYERSELIGHTHHIINSGYHPKAFFQQLWRTISSGQVWNGEICNRAKDGSLYWVHTTIVPFMDSTGVPVQYISIRADITQRKELEQSIQHMALYDELTGLPNRRLMTDRLQVICATAARSGHHGAMMFLDLDNFKEINDAHGHELGDELLKQVAQRLGENVRQVDTVARAGGDEFILLLTDLSEDPVQASIQAYNIAEKVRSVINEPYHVDRFVLYASPSIGIVTFADESKPRSDLLKQADMALYRAKAHGKNQICIFDPSLQAEVVARASMLADLRQALQKDEFRLYYQPVVNQQHQIIGHEALIRWSHPVRGLVAPIEFIGLAEQTGLILDIGQWVLVTACRQLHAWSQDDVKSRWTLSVNVSARQFRDPHFVGKVRHAIQQAGANPQRLWLELTESMFHTDIQQTIEKMQELKDIGVRFSLDDFGTGYSSLSVLKLLPLDQVKIDRSFVKDVIDDPNDAAIVHTILALAKILDLAVVAEGIDAINQFDFLQQHGCHAFQGYYFGKPAPVT